MDVQEQPHPSDKFNLVYLVFLLHGIGVLLPWNMFITARSYFVEYKLYQAIDSATSLVTSIMSSTPTPSIVSDAATGSTFINGTLSVATDIASTFLSSTTTTPSSLLTTPFTNITDDAVVLNSYQTGYMSATGVAANIPNVLFNGINLFIQSKKGNMKNRITAMIMVECSIILVTIVMIFIDTSQHLSAFYYFTLMTITIMNMANGVYQSSVYGLAATLPESYSNAIILGNNLCGTLVSIISIISKASSAEPKGSAVVYFCSTLAVLVLCLISLHLLKINRYYRHREELSSSTETSGEQDKSLVDENGEQDSRWKHYQRVFAGSWPLFLDIFMIFFVTLAVFPEVTSNVRSSGQMAGLGNYFTDVTCFLCFNLSALIGSFLPKFFFFPRAKYLWIPVFARLLFFPFFLMCNYNPLTRPFTVLIPNDWIYTLGVTLLGLTSGYYSALGFRYLDTDRYGAECSMLAAFFLVLGVFLGVSFAYVWQFMTT